MATLEYMRRKANKLEDLAEVYTFAAAGVWMEMNCNSHPVEDRYRYEELAEQRQQYTDRARVLAEEAESLRAEISFLQQEGAAHA